MVNWDSLDKNMRVYLTERCIKVYNNTAELFAHDEMRLTKIKNKINK